MFADTEDYNSANWIPLFNCVKVIDLDCDCCTVVHVLPVFCLIAADGIMQCFISLNSSLNPNDDK